jgi:hypothetical protein
MITCCVTLLLKERLKKFVISYFFIFFIPWVIRYCYMILYTSTITWVNAFFMFAFKLIIIGMNNELEIDFKIGFMNSSFVSITLLETYAHMVPKFFIFIISTSILSPMVGLLVVASSYFHISYFQEVYFVDKKFILKFFFRCSISS